MIIVSRKEDMSPSGFLQLIIQEDGDAVITIQESDGNGDMQGMATASVEFTTPFIGGGGSRRTHTALLALAKAMAEDNAERRNNRTGCDLGACLIDNNPNKESDVEQELSDSCPHQDNGWCVDCVKDLTEEKKAEPTSVITVRLPVSMHQELKSQAHINRISLNKLCIIKLGYGLKCAKPAPADLKMGDQGETPA